MFIRKYSFGNSLKNFSCIRLVLHLRTIKYFKPIDWLQEREVVVSLYPIVNQCHIVTQSLCRTIHEISALVYIYIGRARPMKYLENKIFEKNDSKIKVVNV